MVTFGKVLRDLASRDYSARVFGHWSHDRFIIGTASSYEESLDAPHDELVTIENVRGETFLVGFANTGCSHFGWHRENNQDVFDGCLRECSTSDLVPLVDQVIQNLLPPVEPGSASERAMNRNRTIAQQVGQADTDKAAVLGR